MAPSLPKPPGLPALGDGSGANLSKSLSRENPMRRLIPSALRSLLLALVVAVSAAAPIAIPTFAAPAFAAGTALVKLSSSGICHTPDSPWYDRTRDFTPYDSLEACLAHGRLPKGMNGGAAGGMTSAMTGGVTGSRAQKTDPISLSSGSYRRETFGPGWLDADGDCADTRAEKLAELSTVRVVWNETGCRVVRGRWIDPYTDKVVLEARDLDIDHIVPLAWAWAHGADTWSSDRRKAFANDPVNLLPVDASANRAKGALGPDDWLPPSRKFRCEYVLRFTRIALGYGLLDAATRADLASVRSRVCA